MSCRQQHVMMMMQWCENGHFAAHWMILPILMGDGGGGVDHVNSSLPGGAWRDTDFFNDMMWLIQHIISRTKSMVHPPCKYLCRLILGWGTWLCPPDWGGQYWGFINIFRVLEMGTLLCPWLTRRYKDLVCVVSVRWCLSVSIYVHWCPSVSILDVYCKYVRIDHVYTYDPFSYYFLVLGSCEYLQNLHTNVQ